MILDMTLEQIRIAAAKIRRQHGAAGSEIPRGEERRWRRHPDYVPPPLPPELKEQPGSGLLTIPFEGLPTLTKIYRGPFNLCRAAQPLGMKFGSGEMEGWRTVKSVARELHDGEGELVIVWSICGTPFTFRPRSVARIKEL